MENVEGTRCKFHKITIFTNKILPCERVLVFYSPEQQTIVYCEKPI